MHGMEGVRGIAASGLRCNVTPPEGSRESSHLIYSFCLLFTIHLPTKPKALNLALGAQRWILYSILEIIESCLYKSWALTLVKVLKKEAWQNADMHK